MVHKFEKKNPFSSFEPADGKCKETLKHLVYTHNGLEIYLKLPPEKDDLMRQKIKMLTEILNKDPKLREMVAQRALLDKKAKNALVLSVRNTQNLLIDVLTVIPSS